MIIKLQNGNILKLSKEESDYLNWKKLSPKQKQQSRINKAKSYLNSGPSVTNLWNAFQSYIGNRDPENPYLNIGIVNAPGRATPLLVLQSAKLMETINNYWKNLGKFKIRLGGNGKYASGILTKPGTASTTFNGQNINYITSPKGGKVTHKFYTDLGSEYILTKDGFARRIKSPHSNVGSSDVGLHNWNEGTTIFTKGEDGKLFNTAFYKLNDFGFKPGTYGLVKQNGKAKIMLIDPKTKLWREAMFSDVYPTSVKLGLLLDRILSTDYSDIPFIGGHILEKGSGGWHPGSSVAFIEGMKQGGFIKSANARKWKHAKGGILYGSEGMDLGYDMNQGIDTGMGQELKKNKTAPIDSKGDLKEAYDWFKLRYSNVNWNNMNYIYNQFKKAGIPYDTAIAVMGNIVHESQGDPRRRQVGGGPGYGLLQWNKGTEPGDTLVAQTRGIISALKNPAGQSNYWYHGGAGSGFRTGADAQKYIMSKNNYNFTNKTKVFSSSYLRPGKPHLEDRIKSSRLLARLYKEYNKGGIL